MNIYDPYPDHIELEDGKIIRLNLAYDRVLRVLDLVDRQDLTTKDKLAAQCAWLLDEREPMPETWQEHAAILQAVMDLFPKNEKQSERYIDFHQDAAMIRSAFFRIGVDLTVDKIHFFQFLELLADLPSDTALMRVMEIRQRPIPAVNKHNREQVAALIKAKQRVAIKYSEDERKKRFAESLKNSSTILRG